MKGTFSTLDPNAKIFDELKIQQPKWRNLFSSDKELYINIRKDNYINVYYFGGLLVRINYKNGFVAQTHQKYLGDATPRGKDKKGNDKFEYDHINLAELDEEMIASMKSRIKSDYLKHIDDEYPAEKWIQGKMVNENPCYVDSEFQFNQDKEIGKLRIDLIELSDGVLSFVELKGISDSRLRNDVNRNASVPEIIEQMMKYKLFITKYEADILKYYQRLLEIKMNLGLLTIENVRLELNKRPKLVIADTYQKMTKGRDKRIFEIKKLLDFHGIDYVITK